MSEEFQSPSVSSSVRLDDILEDSTREGAEKAPDDLQPLKPGAGDAPVFSPAAPAPPPVPAPRIFESPESNDVTTGTSQDDLPPPLPARSRREPDSTWETAADTEFAKTRPESMDFSVNLKDQPSSGEPVGPQDAAPVHVEPVPVFVSSFSSDSSISELTMSAKAVHADDLMQTEVPVKTILPSVSGFVENTVDKQVADHLENVHTQAEKAQMKPAIRKSSELDALIFVDESSFQYNEHQCAESNESQFKRTVSSLVEETMPEQDTADKEGLVKISNTTSIEKVELSNEREVELGPHLGLKFKNITESKTDLSPLNRIIQESESMHDILDFKETIKSTDSGLNFCYGDILETKERNELNSCTATNQVAVTDDDTNKSTINVTVKTESAAFQGQEVLEMLHDTEKRIMAQGSKQLDCADVETFAERSFDQVGKLSPTEAYFAVSQVLVESEPQTCMTYATFDSSNMLLSPQSEHFNEMISVYDAADGGKTELQGTSKFPILFTVLESEVTKIEDEVKSVPLLDSGNKHVSKVDGTSTEIDSHLLGGFAFAPDQHIKSAILGEDMISELNFALDQSQIKSCEMAEVSFGVEMRQSTPQLLTPFEPPLSNLEQCSLGVSEEVQGLIDVAVKAPCYTGTEAVEMITDPGYAKVQSIAQNESKEQTVHASIHHAANGTIEVTKIQHLLEEQKTVPHRASEDPTVNSEQISISQGSNLTKQLLVDSNKELVIKDEDLYEQSGCKEFDAPQNINQSINESGKQELLSSKIVEEKYSPPSLTPKQVVTVERQDMSSCNEVTDCKSEPIMGALGDTTVGMKPFEKILTDSKHGERCSLQKPSLRDEIETSLLIKNISEDDLAGSVKVTDKAMVEIMRSHQEASGELLPSSGMSEKYAVEESIYSLIEDISTSSSPLVLSEDLSTVSRGLPVQISAEESCLNISHPVTVPVTPSQDKFSEHWENLSEMKVKADGHSVILEHAQVQIMPQALPTGASFPLNEEVTKASKEVVTKILETSVALAEVLGEKEGTRAICVSQHEAEITSIVGEDEAKKKNIPVELLVPELTVAAESTETSKDSAVADISVKLDKKSVVDLIYWRDIKKTGLVFGASLFLLLSMTIFSIVSVIAYLGLAVLSVTISFRIYRGILQAVQKSDDGHPFKACLEKDVAVSDELVHKYSDIGLGHINHVTTELRRLFLVQDLVDSLKFSVLMWLLTYVGALFNGLTLLIIALVAVFSIPVVYERHQAQIDHYIGIASKQIRDVTAKIQAKVPGLKKKTE